WSFVYRHAVSLDVCKNAAYSGMGVLAVVDRILTVLSDGETQVKLQMCVGGAAVKEVSCGVAGHLVKKVGKAYGLACSLGHSDHFSVSHKADKLHEHYLKSV